MQARYQNGFSQALTAIKESEILDGNWTKLGIFTFVDTSLLDSTNLSISPEQVLTGMMEHIRSQSNPTILVLSTRRIGQGALRTKEGLTQYLSLLESLGIKAAIFHFGVSSLLKCGFCLFMSQRAGISTFFT